jgi:hypothetical protein
LGKKNLLWFVLWWWWCFIVVVLRAVICCYCCFTNMILFLILSNSRIVEENIPEKSDVTSPSTTPSTTPITSNPLSIGTTTVVSSMAAANGTTTTGRMPSITSDKGLEIIAFAMGKHDVVIDMSLMLLTERVRLVVVSGSVHKDTGRVLVSPQLRFRLSHPVLKINMEHNQDVRVTFQFADDESNRMTATPLHLRKGISVYFYNMHVLSWEPVVEPWRFHGDVRLRVHPAAVNNGARGGGNGSGVDIEGRSPFDLNVNITHTFVDVMNAWWKQEVVNYFQPSEKRTTQRSRRSRARTGQEEKEGEGEEKETKNHDEQGEQDQQDQQDEMMMMQRTPTSLVYQHVLRNDCGLELSFVVIGGGYDAHDPKFVQAGKSEVFEVAMMQVEERWYVLFFF